MAFDQQINYKVRLDDSDFQAKLSQMRASIDMTMGGAMMGGYAPGMMGGYAPMMMGGMAPSTMMGGMVNMMSRNTDMVMGGLADFGSQVRPVTYTPPAIAMQPHFGMITMQQSTGQALAGSLGFPGIGIHAAQAPIKGAAVGGLVGGLIGGVPGAIGGALFGGIHQGMGVNFNRDLIPMQISAAEYMQLSARNFGTQFGDAAAAAALVTAGTGAGLVTGGLGAIAGTSLGGTLGGLAGGLVGGTLASAFVGSVSDMMAENRAVQTQLEAGSFRFLTGGKDVDPLTGRGFSRRARAEIADFVQTLEVGKPGELGDVRFGMGELKQVMEAGMQMDLFSGTKDAEDFKGKFKGLVETIKTVTATLHTSLKDGIEVIRGFRDMGVTDTGDIMRLTLRSEAIGRQSGRTGMEMMAIGQTGAEMFRGTGISMQLGFELNQMNTGLVRSLLTQGLISRETIGQAGGENSLAQQLTANALASTQTAFGRGAMMAAFDPRTGGLRDGALANMGNRDLLGLVQNAANLTPAGIMSFQAHQEEIISGMTPMQLQLFSAMPAMAAARTLTNAFGGKFEDNFVANQLRQGIPRHVIDSQLALLRADPEKIKDENQLAINMVGQQQQMEEIRNRFGLKAVSNIMRRTFVQPVQRAFTELSTSAGEAVDNMTMRFLGGNVTDKDFVSEASVKRGRSLVDSGEAAIDPGVDDISASFLQKIAGGGQSGERLAKDVMEFGSRDPEGNLTFMGGKVLEFESKEAAEAHALSTNQRLKLLTTSAKGGRGPILAVSSQDLGKMLEARRGMQATQKEKDAAEKFRLTEEQELELERLSSREMKGEKIGFEQVGRLLFGEEFGDEKKLGFQTEVIARAAEEHGLTRASKEISGRVKSGITDAAAKTAALSFQEAEALAKKDRFEVATALGRNPFHARAAQMVSKFGVEEMHEVAILATASEDSEEFLKARSDLRRRIKTMGGDEQVLRQLVEGVRGDLKEDQKKRLEKHADMIDVKNLMGSQAQEALAGVKGLTPGGPLAEVSKDAMSQMILMAEQLNNQMKMLITLQEQFKKAAGVR